MKLKKYLRLFLLLMVGISINGCSNDPDFNDGNNGTGGNGNKDTRPYTLNKQLTDQIASAWKITEYEPTTNSYYTKDFETSWVFIGSLSGGASEPNNLSYKLAAEKEIHNVRNVEVGTYSDGADWIVDADSYEKIFCIEDLHSAGNYYVMIIRDKTGNRYRCHSVNDPHLFYIINGCRSQSVRVDYLSEGTIDNSGNFTEVNKLGNFVRSHETSEMLDGAPSYVVLVEKPYNLRVKLTGKDGSEHIYITDAIDMRKNVWTIDDSFLGGNGGGDEGDGPYDDRQIKLQEKLKGKSYISLDGLSWFYFDDVPGLGSIASINLNTTNYTLRTSESGLYFRNENDRYVVMNIDSNKGTEDICYMTYDEASDTVTIWKLYDTTGIKKYKLYEAKAILVGLENKTSYPLVDYDFNYTIPGYDITVNLPRGNSSSMYPNTKVYLINLKTGKINIDIDVKGYGYKNMNGTGSYDTMSYKGTIKPTGNKICKIDVNDSMFTSEPTEEDIQKLTQILWTHNKATAWRVSGYATDASNLDKMTMYDDTYGWLITECIGFKQGVHFCYEYNTQFTIDGNFYLKWDEKNKLLKFVNWEEGKKDFDILTPISEILSKGTMLVRPYDAKQHIYKCEISLKPLIIGIKRGSGVVGYRRPYYYDIVEHDTYGRELSKRTTNSYIQMNSDENYGSFILASDEVISESANSMYDIKMSCNGGYTVESKNLKLDQIYWIEIIK